MVCGVYVAFRAKAVQTHKQAKHYSDVKSHSVFFMNLNGHFREDLILICNSFSTRSDVWE